MSETYIERPLFDFESREEKYYKVTGIGPKRLIADRDADDLCLYIQTGQLNGCGTDLTKVLNYIEFLISFDDEDINASAARILKELGCDQPYFIRVSDSASEEVVLDAENEPQIDVILPIQEDIVTKAVELVEQQNPLGPLIDDLDALINEPILKPSFRRRVLGLTGVIAPIIICNHAETSNGEIYDNLLLLNVIIFSVVWMMSVDNLLTGIYASKALELKKKLSNYKDQLTESLVDPDKDLERSLGIIGDYRTILTMLIDNFGISEGNIKEYLKKANLKDGCFFMASFFVASLDLCLMSELPKEWWFYLFALQNSLLGIYNVVVSNSFFDRGRIDTFLKALSDWGLKAKLAPVDDRELPNFAGDGDPQEAFNDWEARLNAVVDSCEGRLNQVDVEVDERVMVEVGE